MPNVVRAAVPQYINGQWISAGDEIDVSGFRQGALESMLRRGRIYMDSSEAGGGGLVEANVQTGSYTLVLSDAGQAVEMDVASANDLTVPPESSVDFPVGTVIEVAQVGEGQTTIVEGSGVDVRTPETLVLTGQWSTVSLRKRGSDEWLLAGDVEPS